MRIDELVSMDMQGDFRSDVQLSDYENTPLNRDLLRNYIFTVHAPATFGAIQRSLSASDVLEQLKNIFAFQSENRIALIANYGHGKSHLALVLANFFARPADSEEVQIVLERLGQALSSQPKLAVYRDLKNDKGEFLVVRLQGDRFGDLQEGFLRALEQALREHSSTCKIEIPLWTRHAETWLKSLQGEMRQRAESFLAQEKIDIASLLGGLRRQGAYDLVRQLFKHLNGVYPDFGREISLEDMVIWAVDEVCKPRGLGGLLILFDEFSLFLQKYMAARTAGKLQELLNGISKRQSQSAFLALSQQDLDTVAENYAQGQRRDDVRKELERLPKDKRSRLYSLMEAVLASYLKQNDTSWQSWSAQRPVKSALSQAREITLKHFDRRYTQDLRWEPNAIDQKLIKGCFPLHPLTTAILSVHNFESGGSETRTALQFVRSAWGDLCQQSAQVDGGRPNFVLPIALVDFFQARLSQKWYEAYKNIETGPQPLDPDQCKVLQALLVQQAVALKATAGDQIELLGHLSGLENERVKEILKELADARMIQFDPVHKVSSLYPASTRPQEVEEIVRKAAQRIPIDHALMDKIARELGPFELSLSFGHSSDWVPRQIVLVAAMFNAQELGKQLEYYRHSGNGIQDGVRGLVVWLIAQSEEEKSQLRQAAASVLEQALGNIDYPLPVVVMLPRKASPDLIALAQRLEAVERLGPNEREKIGSMMHQQETHLARNRFIQAVEDAFGGKSRLFEIKRNLVEYAVPGAYRYSVQTLQDLSLKSVIAECYRQAYVRRVEFFTQYAVSKKGVNKLREAIREVAHWLFSDTAGNSIRNLGNKDVKHQLSTSYLTQKWGLLATTSYAIQRPTLRALQQAWDLLEDTFQPGCQDVAVRSVLLALLNPPYGHDYNTLTLLLAAWIGFHQYEIRLSSGGRVISLKQLKGLFDELKTPQSFLNHIGAVSPLAISRSNPDEIFGQANLVLEQIRQGRPFPISEARDALAQLEQARAHPRLPEAKRQEIEQLGPRLEESLQNAQSYDSQVAKWLRELVTSGFDDLLRLCDGWAGFPALSLVSATQPGPVELQTRWETSLRGALDAFCAKYADLSDLADYKEHENRLQHARKSLKGYPVFVQKVDQAIETLAQHRSELQKQEGEKTIIAEIKSMPPTAALLALYSFREKLSRMVNLSAQTSRLRDEKLRQIESHIQEYERIATDLPQAIDRVIRPEVLRQQRDLLLRKLDPVQGTPLHASLLEAKQRIECLEAFFEQLRILDTRPRGTPEDLVALESKIADMETQFSVWLRPAQKALLEKKKQEVESLRHDKTQKAQNWLTDLERRYKNGANLENLLRESPPAFLINDDLNRLEQIKQDWQRQLDNNVMVQIEALFHKITDIETRRRCLKRLHELMRE